MQPPWEIQDGNGPPRITISVSPAGGGWEASLSVEGGHQLVVPFASIVDAGKAAMAMADTAAIVFRASGIVAVSAGKVNQVVQQIARWTLYTGVT